MATQLALALDLSGGVPAAAAGVGLALGFGAVVVALRLVDLLRDVLLDTRAVPAQRLQALGQLVVDVFTARHACHPQQRTDPNVR